MKGRVNRLVLLVVIAALLFVGGVTMFQDNLIYFPENPPQAAVLADARQHE